MHNISVLMAQINPMVGAISENSAKIVDIILENQQSYDLIIFPELALCGYPSEDLLLRDDYLHEIEKALQDIVAVVQDCHVILGHAQMLEGRRYNAASVINHQRIIQQYQKQKLPNYDVFDEHRYFTPGPESPCVFTINHCKIGLCICEDIWQGGPVEQLKTAGAEVMVCINASPFDNIKQRRRETLIKTHAKDGLTVIYVNMVGAQDELVFDGLSMVYDEQAELCVRAPAFEECLVPVQISYKEAQGQIVPMPEPIAMLYQALVHGTAEYLKKNRFSGALLGLSGGIDSALCLAVAVDAIGADNVHAVMMPSRYTADESNQYALQQAKTLGVRHSTLPIEPAFKSILKTLNPLFANLAADTTEENIQARIRGLLLMALSNKSGKILLSTSNKSETAVGYTTLYGDMSGGFAVLKDVLKTEVYALADYVNREKEIIPEAVIKRAPSAELAENQKDQDSLPDYAILDQIIQTFMLENKSIHQIVQMGFDEVMVNRVIRLIMRNEYKRQQAAPGVKVSPRAFGKDWRFPISSAAFRD